MRSVQKDYIMPIKSISYLISSMRVIGLLNSFACLTWPCNVPQNRRTESQNDWMYSWRAGKSSPASTGVRWCLLGPDFSLNQPLQSTNTLPHRAPNLGTSRIQAAHSAFPTSIIIINNLMFALRQASSLFTRRSFSTTTRIMSQKYEWMVILPDNVGALDKRMAVRE